MKVFLTGATGYIGSHLTPILLSAGHDLSVLARSNVAAENLGKQGITIVRGSLEDVDILTKAASEADAVIHLAYIHDFENYDDKPIQVDNAAIRALAEGLKGSNKPLLITSVLPFGTSYATELDPATFGPRAQAERTLLEYTSQGVRTGIVRLPNVHGDNDKAFVPHVIAQSRKNGVAAYVGEGKTHWAAVHVKDAVQVYKLAVESKVLKGGEVLHAVHDEGVESKKLIELIASKLGVETKSITPEEAATFYTFLGPFVQADITGTSKLTRKLLGWEPKEKTLLEDLETSETYFATGNGSKY
ncbi:3-beta hydroxysteroid dehydrogenase/isomerase [Cryptococcus neoformans c8]|nr:3-beta hydroxysteroid dehydrogenase/isomerase [Cryptococcus neoformans var. grubii AD1-83a]OXG54613.1 3-beta hydroxysteroid dehydrogenase/isomerase [Cryptococcus neoformans var. grubii MW-RSA1955]OXG57880.1 3-beta hydroxysteroid dehydrogenase/isomerase [Cryptococcus neoformans var. grubii CHC193]OXG61133.1 3-beta hydroxysteroid dehydrogenase/isomerase [Cryptococcus neoformans var. grubii c8]OXH06728.1 3-beta hydroxysteroid dehydrogenase/isomerase [Cryptococcus neoformans var. grubii A5-35-17